MPDDDLTKALQSRRISPASYTLNRALSVFRPERVRRQFGEVATPGRRDLTLILRDLVARLGHLNEEESDLAEKILSRPTADEAGAFGYQASAVEKVVCATNVCVNWVEGTTDSPPTLDSDADGVPDQVELTADTFQYVWNQEVGALGYRAPIPDTAGLDGRLDIYISDLGAQGIFGFCLPEPETDSTDWSSAGYCGVDNDFSAQQFGASGGIPALQATAAHEFFHAVQFGYDWLEDDWLMEGTAAWIEDVVYDDINDNYQYLDSSALSIPHIPMDFASQQYGTAYGSWLFWRFLTEYFQDDLTQDPLIIRSVWERADGGPGAPDDYSLLAVDNVLRGRGTNFASAFAVFTAINNWAELWYEEGQAYVDEVGWPPYVERVLSTGRPGMSSARRLDHLTSFNVWLRPGRGLLRTSKLKLAFDLPSRSTGSQATIQIAYRTGAFGYKAVRLDSAGDALTTVPFGKGPVIGVLVTHTNASTRFRSCFQQQTPFSCSGYSTDDRRSYVMAVRAFK